jgi:transposase-like protein
MERSGEELIEEIVQLKTQYQLEVSTGRRTWPRSIKKRAIELQRLDYSNGEISSRTGISSKTLYSWRPKFNGKRVSSKAERLPAVTSNGTFVAVPVIQNNLTDPNPIVRTDLVLQLPHGIRIESVSIDFICELVRRLSEKQK